MPIITPNILPGEPGYISKKERRLKDIEKQKREKRSGDRKIREIGKVRAGSKGFRISRPSSTPRKEQKYIIYRFSKKIGEIMVDSKGIATLKFIRFGGVGNHRHLIQDADFQKRWKNREDDLIDSQRKCFLCSRKLSKSGEPNLYHTKMWQKRAGLLERAEEVPEEVTSGKLSIEEGWDKYNGILEEGNRYYMSLEDTALICATCAKYKNLKL